MASSISKWLVVLPLIKVKAPSEEIGLDGLRLLAPGDEAGWEKLAAEYRIPAEWNPAVGGSRTTNLSNDIKGLPVTWLACEVAAGTEDSARRIAERRMRTFAAVLFSTLYPSRRGLLSKSSARPLNTCVQFPDHKSSGPFTEFHAPFGTIIPPISNPVELTQPDVTAIKDWYRRFQASPDDIKKRCRSGSQFLNYGVVAGGIERFIHFYITLDALFGERYRVERNISRGLRLLFPGEPKWDYRAERLFKLRNSVVHGESVAVEEWDEFESYRSHAGSDPNNDIAAAAMAAFRLFPDNPALAPEPPQAAKGNGGLALCAAAFLSGVYLSSKSLSQNY